MHSVHCCKEVSIRLATVNAVWETIPDTVNDCGRSVSGQGPDSGFPDCTRVPTLPPYTLATWRHVRYSRNHPVYLHTRMVNSCRTNMFSVSFNSREQATAFKYFNFSIFIITKVWILVKHLFVFLQAAKYHLHRLLLHRFLARLFLII